MSLEPLSIISFLLFIGAILFFDLLVIGRKVHVISYREALIWSMVWIALGLAFYFVILNFGDLLHGIDSLEKLKLVAGKYNPYLEFKSSSYTEMLAEYKKSQAINYLSGYFIEETLSVDNIFVILMILRGFSVPLKDYKFVLFWGILGAIILRFLFIFAGVALVQRFDWILLLFGLFLFYQGIRVFFEKEKPGKDPKDSSVIRFLSKHINIFPEYTKDRFWFRQNRKLYFTPLFLVLVMIEFSDLVFAFDSIPAIFAVSRDPYIIFFSNVFAILGLRSLFFLVANLVNRFRFLQHGVAILLIFVGVKLTFHSQLKEWGFQPEFSLYFIGTVMVLSILLSMLFPEKKKL